MLKGIFNTKLTPRYDYVELTRRTHIRLKTVVAYYVAVSIVKYSNCGSVFHGTNVI